ncbi:MAG: hypothetical protein R2830_25050 [Saprospiraceae bacterium]
MVRPVAIIPNVSEQAIEPTKFLTIERHTGRFPAPVALRQLQDGSILLCKVVPEGKRIGDVFEGVTVHQARRDKKRPSVAAIIFSLNEIPDSQLFNFFVLFFPLQAHAGLQRVIKRRSVK